MGVWLLAGIALVLAVKLFKGYFKWVRFSFGYKTLKGVF